MIYLTISCPTIHHWRVLLNRFIGTSITSGLYNLSKEIHFLTWDDKNLHELVRRTNNLEKAVIHKYKEGSFLGLEQIHLMRDLAKRSTNQEEGGFLLWYGLKSVNYTLQKDRGRFLANSDWALLLEYWLIEKHRECISHLQTKKYDVVGQGWVPPSPSWKSPVGSFPAFWVDCDYYLSLPEPPLNTHDLILLTKDDHNYQPFSGKHLVSPRFGVWVEHYIGLLNPRILDLHRAYPLGEHPAWHYHNLYPLERYDATFFEPRS